MLGLGLGLTDLATRPVVRAPAPPQGYVLLVDPSGRYLVDNGTTHLAAPET
jgi:hypothetical protein